jgi:hypothetical protein
MPLRRMIAVSGTSSRRHIVLIALTAAPGPVGPGTDGERKDNLRNKPLSGKLLIQLKGARELDHAPIVATGRSRSSSKAVETYVSFKVEGTQRARSHPTRTDRWMEEFEITVDKANEVEVAIFDKQVSEVHPVPIGLLWIKINDLVEAQRRQKVMAESGAGGWVTAGAMDPDTGLATPGGAMGGPSGDMNAPIGFGDNRMMAQAAAPVGGSEGVDGWFAVEPAGAIALHLNFGEFCDTLHCSTLPLSAACSQGECTQTSTRCWRSWTTGCCSQAQG